MANLRNVFKTSNEGFPSYIIEPVISELDLGNFKKAYDISWRDSRIGGGYVSMEVTYEALANYIDRNKIVGLSDHSDHRGEHVQKALTTPLFIDSLSKKELFNYAIELLKEGGN